MKSPPGLAQAGRGVLQGRTRAEARLTHDGESERMHTTSHRGSGRLARRRGLLPDARSSLVASAKQTMRLLLVGRRLAWQEDEAR